MKTKTDWSETVVLSFAGMAALAGIVASVLGSWGLL